MPLRAVQAKLTASVLRPEFVRFSPVFGLNLLSSPSFVNNLYRLRINASKSRSLGPACDLTRELYFKRDEADEPKPCRNPSKPSFYLTPRILGTITGLAISKADDKSVTRLLRDEGIETNKINGQWTGVSMARFKRLVGTIRDAYQVNPHSATIPLVSRLAWEKSESKMDILNFYRGFSNASGLRVFNDEFIDLVEPKSLRTSEFCEAEFTHDELQDDSILEIASRGLLSEPTNESNYYAKWCRNLELLSASLALSQSFKPAWKLRRHSYKGGKVVPDCVEVCAREVMDYLLYDSDRSQFDLSRLPANCSPKLREFYSTHDSMDELARSRKWFELCQEIDSCEYISNIKEVKYELFPSLKNLFTCLAHLLGQDEWKGDSKRFMTGLNQFLSQELKTNQSLVVEERREMYRHALSEESRRREIALVKFNQSPHYLELTLEGAHRLATAKHGRTSARKWIEQTRPDHYAKLVETTSKIDNNQLFTFTLWPCILQDYPMELLLENDNDDENNNKDLNILALIYARWGSDRNRWAIDREMFAAEMTDQEKRVQRLKNEAMIQKAIKIANTRKDDLGHSLIQWIFNLTLGNVNLIKLALLFDIPNEEIAKLAEAAHQINLASLLRGNSQGLSMLDRGRFLVGRMKRSARS